MEVRHGEELRAALLNPLDFVEILARGTVAIAAGVVEHDLVATGIALLDVAAQRGGTAHLEGVHGAALGGR